MKKIEAIIRAECVDRVRRALEDLSYPGLTLTEVKGHGKQKGLRQQWRGTEYLVDLLPKVKLEVAAVDQDVPQLIRGIADAAHTGNIGDGKIFVTPLEEAVRIRTGERGEEAI